MHARMVPVTSEYPVLTHTMKIEEFKDIFGNKYKVRDKPILILLYVDLDTTNSCFYGPAGVEEKFFWQAKAFFEYENNKIDFVEESPVGHLWATKEKATNDVLNSISSKFLQYRNAQSEVLESLPKEQEIKNILENYIELIEERVEL